MRFLILAAIEIQIGYMYGSPRHKHHAPHSKHMQIFRNFFFGSIFKGEENEMKSTLLNKGVAH